MDAIAHTLGATSDAMQTLARLHFSFAIAPATLSNPQRDIEQIARARTAGLSGLLFDLTRYGPMLASRTTTANIENWLDTLTGQWGFTGVWLSDVDMLDEAAWVPLDAAKARGLWTACSISARAGNIAQAAAHVNAMAFPLYAAWGGDGDTESTLEIDGATTTSLWEARVAALPAGVEPWPMLQGFFDRQWGVTSANKQPTYALLDAVWQDCTGVEALDASYVVFGWGAFPGTQSRYTGFGQEPAIQDHLGLFNGVRRGRLYVYPSRAMVRRGEVRVMQSSMATAVWRIVSAPMGCDISSAGIFRAGNEDGVAVIAAEAANQYASAELMVFQEP